VTWELVWLPAAIKDLRRLDRRTAERIREATRRFAETGHGDIRRVQSRPPELGLRVGDWRVFFVYVHAERAIHVLRVRPRGSAYQD
jgi:mRNA-degrading endonuclease RelE of RelBE toxin-antitoxin system